MRRSRDWYSAIGNGRSNGGAIEVVKTSRLLLGRGWLVDVICGSTSGLVSRLEGAAVVVLRYFHPGIGLVKVRSVS